MSMEEIKYLKVNFHQRMPYFSKCLLLFYLEKATTAQ